MTKPEFNEVNSITGKRCHKVCPVGMTGRVALVLILFTLLPMVATSIMIEYEMLLPGKNIYIAVPVFFGILIIPFSKLIAHYLINRDFKLINAFCSSVKDGSHKIYFDLPDQKEEEDDLIILLRNLNWMSRTLEIKHLKSVETIDKAQEKYREMKIKASTDPLTGLYNRRYLELMIGNDRRTVLSSDDPVSLICIDCDRFKYINDTLGHKAGDELLVCLADCIRKNIRFDQDVPVRLGGDEFAVLLPLTGEQRAKRIAGRIRNFYNNCKVGDTSLSIGISTIKGIKEMNMVVLEALIHGADEQVYKAKHAGGDTIFAGCILPDSIKFTDE